MKLNWHNVRYDTIRDAILTCARKPTWVGLIYRAETTTKNCETETIKTKSRYVRSNSKSLGNYVVSSEEENVQRTTRTETVCWLPTPTRFDIELSRLQTVLRTKHATRTFTRSNRRPFVFVEIQYTQRLHCTEIFTRLSPQYRLHSRIPRMFVSASSQLRIFT